MNKLFCLLKKVFYITLVLNFTVSAANVLPVNPWQENIAETEQTTVSLPGSAEKALKIFSGLGFIDISTGDAIKEISYSEYSNLINKVTNGEINLADTLREKITYADIIKSLVLLTGYGAKAEAKGGSDSAYNSVAATNGIMKDFSENIKENASYYNAVLLVYNAVKIDIISQTSYGKNSTYSVQKGETVLSKYADIYYDKGRITADSFTSLDSKVGLTDGKLAIDEKIFGLDEISPLSNIQIGAYGEYYYRENEKEDTAKLLMFYTDDELSKKTVIYPRNIYSFSGECVLTAEDPIKNKRVNYKISKTANVIRNRTYIGRKAHTLKKDDFTFGTGNIVLIDSHCSGVYDVVCINNYDNRIVSSVNPDEWVIYCKFGGLPVTLEDGVLTEKVLKNASGTKISIDKLREWDVIEVAKNDDGDITEVIVYDDSAVGTVTEFNNEEYVIGGEAYYISPDFIKTDKDLALSTDITALLNINGEIIAITTATVAVDEEYVYLIDAWYEKEHTKKDISFKVFALDGKINTYEGAEKIRLNGKVTDNGEELMKALQYGGSEVKSELVIISLDGMGRVKTIKQPYDEWDEKHSVPYYDNPLKISAYAAKRIFKSGFLCYKTSEGTFDPTTAENAEAYKEFFVTQSTVFLSVPDAEKQKSATKGYDIKRYADFLRDGVYSVTGYNSNENYEMGVVIVEEKSATMSDNDAQTAVVGKIYKALNSDEEVTDCVMLAYNGNIKGYSCADNLTVYEWNYSSSSDTSSTLALEDINSGDVVRISINGFGELTAIARMLNVKEPPDEFVNSRNMYGEKAYGHVKKKLAGMFILETSNGGAENSYIYKPDGSTKYYLFNKSTGKLSLGTYADIIDDATAFDGSELYLRARDTNLQEVVIYKGN